MSLVPEAALSAPVSILQNVPTLEFGKRKTGNGEPTPTA